MITMLSPNSGVVNYFIQLLGFEPVYFLGSETYFRFTLVVSAIWKEVGWGYDHLFGRIGRCGSANVRSSCP